MAKLEVIEGLGYRDDDIRRELGEERFAQFCKWMNGQTVALSSKGQLLTYPSDYERFLAGLPCID